MIASKPEVCSDWCQMNSTGWPNDRADRVKRIVVAIRPGKLHYTEFHRGVLLNQHFITPPRFPGPYSDSHAFPRVRQLATAPPLTTVPAPRSLARLCKFSTHRNYNRKEPHRKTQPLPPLLALLVRRPGPLLALHLSPSRLIHLPSARNPQRSGRNIFGDRRSCRYVRAVAHASLGPPVQCRSR